MNLVDEIEEMLGEGYPVGRRTHTAPGGKEMAVYSVNVHGPVFQFAIPVDETNPGVIEDFLENIDAVVKQNS